jgi:hypothetical protein
MESAASLMISANEKQDRNVMLCCETRRYQHANYAYTILLPVPLQEQQQKIPHLYCFNQLAVRQLIAEVHIKTSSAIPFTAKISPSHIFTTGTCKSLKKLLGQSLSTIQVRCYNKRRANE